MIQTWKIIFFLLNTILYENMLYIKENATVHGKLSRAERGNQDTGMAKKEFKILIAEDDEDLHFLYDRMLKKDYEIIRAFNGKDAIELFKKNQPDLTLMDIKMPELNGDEAIEAILRFDPQAKIVAITAFTFPLEKLSVPILRKGFRCDELVDFIKKSLGQD